MLSIIVTAASLMLAAPLATAAPLCSQSLLPRPTPEQISTTIEGLARLKLSIDLAQAQNSTSVANKIMTGEFARTLSELTQHLENQKSSTEIQQLIKESILRLQKEDRVQKEVEIKVREQQQMVLPKWLPKDLALALGNTTSQLQYAPETKDIVYLFSGKLKRYSLAKQKTEVITDEEIFNFALNSYAKTIVYLNKNGHLITYDLQKNSVVADIILKIPKEHLISPSSLLKLALSPDGKTLALQSSSRICFYSAKSGKLLSETTLTTGFVIKQFRYISNSRVLFSGGQDLYSYDLKSRSQQPQATLKTHMFALWETTSDHSMIVAQKAPFLLAITLGSDIPHKKYFQAGLPVSEGLNLTYVPSKKENLILINIPDVSTGIYEASDLKNPRFDFQGRFGSHNPRERVESVIVTPDGKQALLFVKEIDSDRLRPELWELPFE
jgi:hypothetical protein